MQNKQKYLFGPVPSRRLGLSLGTDIVPLKSCTQNCLYCQLGSDGIQTLDRKSFIPVNDVLSEIKDAINNGLKADYITLSGSGEPTLNSDIGTLIQQIKQLTDIPVAVITNGTLLCDPAVRADCAKADVVLPSLDAGDEETFEKINQPHQNLNFRQFVDGLIEFRKEYTGQIWLEVFFIEDINTDDSQVEKMKNIIARIKPDKIQLNTAVRPTTDSSVIRVNESKLNKIAKKLGPTAEVVADFSKIAIDKNVQADADTILAMLKRRPCTLDDICTSLSIHRTQAIKNIAILQTKNLITTEQKNNTTYYKAKT